MDISPALRQRLIISADDYGIRHTAEPILRLIRARKIDRVAVLVRYVTQDEAEALLATGVKIDLHLDIIRLLGRGETPGDRTSWRGFQFVSRFVLGHIRPKVVEAEWRSQIERFRSLFGRLPDGLNSHEHVHYFPPFFRVITHLAKEYRIPSIRFGLLGHLMSWHHSLIGHILMRFHKRNKKLFLERGLATTTYLVSYDWIRHFPSFIDHLPAEGDIELVVHPERTREYQFAAETLPSL